jgi:hypothetical protein
VSQQHSKTIATGRVSTHVRILTIVFSKGNPV